VDPAPTTGLLPSDHPIEFTLTLDGAASDETWAPVYGKLSMVLDGSEQAGTIMVNLWMKDKNDKEYNKLSLKFSPIDGELNQTDIEIYADPADPDDTPHIKKTVTTTCSWPMERCTITKGE